MKAQSSIKDSKSAPVEGNTFGSASKWPACTLPMPNQEVIQTMTHPAHQDRHVYWMTLMMQLILHIQPALHQFCMSLLSAAENEAIEYRRDHLQD